MSRDSTGWTASVRPAGGALSRRGLLGGAAALPVVLGGCSSGTSVKIAPPLPDVAVLAAAIAAEQNLIALYQAAIVQHTSLASRLEAALGHHREHLTVLRRHHVPGTGEDSPTPPAPSSPVPAVPGSTARTLSALRTAETRAAADRAKDVEQVTAGVAQLMAGIGACEAGHAAALGKAAR